MIQMDLDGTLNPTKLPIQDAGGIPIQDNSEENLEANLSITEI